MCFSFPPSIGLKNSLLKTLILFVVGISYPSRHALLQGLKSHALDGAFIDVLTVDSFKRDLDDFESKVVKILPSTFYYGVILTGEAKNLSEDFKEYLLKHPVELLGKEVSVTSTNLS